MPFTSAPLIDLSPSALPPALQAQFNDVVNLLIVETIFPTLLIPIAICLFMFTKPEIQRKPVFILNVLSIMLGLVFGGITIATVSRVVAGRQVSPNFVTTVTGLYFFIPVCVQCILFVRILAVYPPRAISKPLTVAIYGTLLVVTLVRVVNLALALKDISETAHLSANPWAVTGVARRVPSVTVELSLGLVYDILASSLFLFRLRQGGALRAVNPLEKSIVSSDKRSSYPARLRALFWIALTNFVLPVIFNIVLLVLVRTEDSSGTIRDTIVVLAVMSVNVYVQIVSGLLATLWCHSSPHHWQTTARSTEGLTTESYPTVKFAPSSALTSRVHVVEVETMHASGRGEELP